MDSRAKQSKTLKGDRLSEIRELIERNAAARGWLIFATHDVCTGPSDYGYTPDDFSRIVDLSQRSGARVLTMSQVCQQLGVLPDQEKVDAHNLNPN